MNSLRPNREVRGAALPPPPIRPVKEKNVSKPSAASYLVACHWDWSEYSKPYAVYKVDVATSHPPRAKWKRLHRVGRVPTVAGGKAFASVRSAHRAWIVGVGGDPGGAVIFDTKTRKVIHGPVLNSAKWCPVLTAVGDKVYALSKTPCWIRDPDFPPWFEVLDLSNAKVITAGDRSHLHYRKNRNFRRLAVGSYS
jgi:hypothetical protein